MEYNTSQPWFEYCKLTRGIKNNTCKLFIFNSIILGFRVFWRMSKCDMGSFKKIYGKRKSASCVEAKM